MSISPVGGVIYANQNMQIPASKQIDFQNRLDLQNSVAAQILNEKEEEIAEVRPTEETYRIDPEKEHEREKNDESTGEKEEENKFIKQNKNSIKKDKIQEIKSTHHLDIKV